MRSAAALSLLLVLAACGGSGEDTTPKAEPSPTEPATSPTIAPPTGEPVPGALSQFRCDPDGAGTFVATGVLKNSTKAKVTFQVTVYVGEATGAPASARTERLPDVAAGGSVDFTVDAIPAPAEGGTCHVQALTTK